MLCWEGVVKWDVQDEWLSHGLHERVSVDWGA